MEKEKDISFEELKAFADATRLKNREIIYRLLKEAGYSCRPACDLITSVPLGDRFKDCPNAEMLKIINHINNSIIESWSLVTHINDMNRFRDPLIITDVECTILDNDDSSNNQNR
jgi:hypothetical protein